MDKMDFFGYVMIAFVVIVCLFIYLQDSDLQLKCVVSGVDGNKYCVRDRNQVNAAADLLARVTNKCKKLVEYMKNRYPDNEMVALLVKNYNPAKIMETLPTSTYTAYSENKGEKIAFCLNKKKKDNNILIDEHTLMFVAIHEMSHTCTKSIGHKSEFWENFKFMLEGAKDAGIHEPVDYNKEPVEYCDMTIKDSPYFEL
jgi:hypothetical protein